MTWHVRALHRTLPSVEPQGLLGWGPPHRCSRTPLLLKGLGLTVGCRALPTLPWPGRLLQPQPESWGSWPFPGHNWLPHAQIHALPSVCGAHPPLCPAVPPLPIHTFLSCMTSTDAATSRKPPSRPTLFSRKLQLPKQLKHLMCPGQGLARAPWQQSPDPGPSFPGA